MDNIQTETDLYHKCTADGFSQTVHTVVTSPEIRNHNFSLLVSLQTYSDLTSCLPSHSRSPELTFPVARLTWKKIGHKIVPRGLIVNDSNREVSTTSFERFPQSK